MFSSYMGKYLVDRIATFVARADDTGNAAPALHQLELLQNRSLSGARKPLQTAYAAGIASSCLADWDRPFKIASST